MGLLAWGKRKYDDLINSPFFMAKTLQKIDELRNSSILTKEICDELNKYEELSEKFRSDFQGKEELHNEASEAAEKYKEEMDNAKRDKAQLKDQLGIVGKVFNGLFAHPIISKLTTIGLGLGAAAATIMFSPIGLLGGAGIGLAAFGAKMLGSAAYCNLSVNGREYRRLDRKIKMAEAAYKYYDNRAKITDIDRKIALKAMEDADRRQNTYFKALINQSKLYKDEFRMIKTYNQLNEEQRKFIIETFGESAKNELEEYIDLVRNNWYKECDGIKQPCNIKHVADVLESIRKGKIKNINPKDSDFRKLSGEDDEYDDDLEDEFEEEFDDELEDDLEEEPRRAPRRREEPTEEPRRVPRRAPRRRPRRRSTSDYDMSDLEDIPGARVDEDGNLVYQQDEDGNKVVQADENEFEPVDLQSILKNMSDNDKKNKFYTAFSPNGPINFDVFNNTVNRYFKDIVSNDHLLACIGMMGSNSVIDILTEEEVNQIYALQNNDGVTEKEYYAQTVRMLANHIPEIDENKMLNAYIRCGIELFKRKPEDIGFISEYYNELEKSKADNHSKSDSNREQEPEEEITIPDFLKNRNKDSNDDQQL